MVQSQAKTVEEYLTELPDDRRAVLSSVRDVVLKNLPEGYQETMNWGMISYEVPLSTYPDTYNKKPLQYVGLAAQKNHFGLYLCAIYQDLQQEQKLRDGFAKSGKKLDLGKSCVRFRKLEDLDLKVVGKIIASHSPAKFIKLHEKSRGK